MLFGASREASGLQKIFDMNVVLHSEMSHGAFPLRTLVLSTLLVLLYTIEYVVLCLTAVSVFSEYLYFLSAASESRLYEVNI